MQNQVDDDDANDGFVALKPARRGALECMSFVTDAPDPWYAIYAFGTATDDVKNAALKKLQRGGDRLNSNLFLEQDSHELWVAEDLAGLCKISTRARVVEDSADIMTNFDAIFLLKKFRGHGVSSVFIDCIWSDLAVAYTSAAAEAVQAGAKSLNIFLIADFESEEGAGVFSHLEGLVDSYGVLLASTFNIKVSVILDAGF